MAANQVGKDFEAKEPHLEKYLKQVRSMEKYFKGFDIKFVKRNHSSEADEQAKIASKGHPLPPDVFYTVQNEPLIVDSTEVKMVSIIEGEDWRAPIIAYLKGFLRA